MICVADEYVMLVKGAETAVLDQLASGPRDVTLDHVNEYAEVCLLVFPYKTRAQGCSMYVLLTKCEAKIAGYWPSFFFFFVFMDRDEVDFHKLTQKTDANIKPSFD